MSDQNVALYAFNRGIVSRLALARVDVKRLALSAEEMTNWMARVMGGMSLRPGLGYITSTYLNRASRDIPFVKATIDTAIIELTDLIMRVQVDDAIITRAAVATTVTNGSMVANLGSWADLDEAGATSSWDATGHMRLDGSGIAAAVRENTVALGAGAGGIRHALRIVVPQGPAVLRVGTTSGDDDLVGETTLGTGTHSITFTPTGTTYIRFQNTLARTVFVYSCEIEAAGDLTLPTPWPAASLGLVRADAESQSADVLFLACYGYQQRKIERRSGESWSIVLYEPDNGPYRLENTGPITMTPSAISGNITLTASRPFFTTNQQGALFRLVTTGQTAQATLALVNDVTGSIEVTGVGDDRIFTVVLTGMTALRVVTLQRSFDNSTWVSTTTTYAADGANSFDDGLDNQIVYYRLKVTTVGGAGNTVATLSIPTGTVIGHVRTTGRQSSTVMEGVVLSPLGSTDPTDNWSEGAWSNYRGWPTVGTFAESRCCWAGINGFWASVTDGFDNFDEETVGDSGPISRSIGSGAVDNINFLVPLSTMILGADGKELACRSSSLEEPLTPSNFNFKSVSTQGSSHVQALKIDDRAVFVDRGGSRVFEVSGDAANKYSSADLTVLCPEIGAPMVVRAAVQRKPDTRLHFVRSDGTACVAVQDRVENVLCWLEVESPGADGLIEDVCVLPALNGDQDDQVYYTIARTIGGVTVRYREKWAQEADCLGDTVSLQADSYVTFDNAGVPLNTVTGLDHLIGETVIAWYDGKCPADADGEIQTFVVDGTGTVTLPELALQGVVGLGYEARYKSAKLGFMPARKGTALTMLKNIYGLALVMANVHAKGVKYGQDFETMDDLPQVEEGAVIDPDVIRAAYDEQSFEFPSSWDTDSRLCLLAQAPRPVTALAAVLSVEMHEA